MSSAEASGAAAAAAAAADGLPSAAPRMACCSTVFFCSRGLASPLPGMAGGRRACGPPAGGGRGRGGGGVDACSGRSGRAASNPALEAKGAGVCLTQHQAPALEAKGAGVCLTQHQAPALEAKGAGVCLTQHALTPPHTHTDMPATPPASRTNARTRTRRRLSPAAAAAAAAAAPPPQLRNGQLRSARVQVRDGRGLGRGGGLAHARCAALQGG